MINSVKMVLDIIEAQLIVFVLKVFHIVIQNVLNTNGKLRETAERHLTR